MKTILLIEDNLSNLENFSEILEISGYYVNTANSGEDGLKKAMSTAPDLILCDIKMADMDGFELKRRLNEWQEKDASLKIPFVFLTARSAPVDIQMAKELRADAFLIKPVEMSLILETIESLTYVTVNR